MRLPARVVPVDRWFWPPGNPNLAPQHPDAYLRASQSNSSIPRPTLLCKLGATPDFRGLNIRSTPVTDNNLIERNAFPTLIPSQSNIYYKFALWFQ